MKKFSSLVAAVMSGEVSAMEMVTRSGEIHMMPFSVIVIKLNNQLSHNTNLEKLLQNMV